MIHIFFDTNVVIDVLADRRPFSIDAAKLLNYSLSGKVKIYVSAVSYNNIYYIMRQLLSNNETMKLLSQLSEMVEIVDVTKNTIKKSIKSDFKDFEDAIQYNCALSNTKIDFIVTRDAKDFKKSTLSILAPKEAVSFVQNTNK